MSILEPEIASAYGALDSDAFADGSPFGAHVLRPMIMSANRLTTKGQHILTMLWPEQTTDYDDPDIAAASFGMASAKAWPWWSRHTLPITVPKRPGLNRADVRLRAKVENGYRVFVAIESRPIARVAESLPLDDANVLTCVGTGTWADYSADSIVIDDGDYDTMCMWILGVAQDVDNEATYGAPRSASIAPPADGVAATTLIDQSANWNPTLQFPATLDYANGGHVVQFTDGTNDVGQPRAVVNVVSPVSLSFHPPLTSDDESRINVRMSGGGLASYKLLKVPRISIACLSIAARARP